MAEDKRITLEQQRAADAWRCAREQTSGKDYVNLAKGLPALIMNSGLIQVLAHLHAKGGRNGNRQHGELEMHLRQWLAQRFDALPNKDFDRFMYVLIEDTDPQRFQQITAEAMAWLRWMRQVAPAVQVDSAGTPA